MASFSGGFKNAERRFNAELERLAVVPDASRSQATKSPTLSLPYSTRLSSPSRTLMLPNTSFVRILICWRIITSVVIISFSILILYFFYSVIEKIIGSWTIIPCVFTLITLIISYLSRLLFRFRLAPFEIVCFRRFDADSARICQTLIAPLLGCYGRVAIVHDKNLDERYDYIDKWQSDVVGDPMTIRFALPSFTVGNHSIYKFEKHNWQEKVGDLLRTADLVIMDISSGMSPSTEWELKESIRCLPAERIWLISRDSTIFKDIEGLLQPSFIEDHIKVKRCEYIDLIRGRSGLRREINKMILSID